MTKEILSPQSGIAWARNTYDPTTGDLGEQTFCIVKISIGRTLWMLKESDDLAPTVVKRDLDSNPEHHSRIYVGLLKAPLLAPIEIVALDERPFSLEDAERINSAARVAARLKETVGSIYFSRKIQEIAKKFIIDLRNIGLDANSKLWEQLGIFKKTLDDNIAIGLPTQFLEIADQMDELGIKEILMEGGSPGTSEFIRKLFTKKEEKPRNSIPL